jgi:non-ribosomal peptide synthetase component E (peptide arylation enzyme)
MLSARAKRIDDQNEIIAELTGKPLSSIDEEAKKIGLVELKALQEKVAGVEKKKV